MRTGYFAMPLHPPGADPARSMDEDLDIWIVGDPDTVAARIAALDHEVGGFGTLLVIAHEGRPRESWERSVTLLKERVIPRVARR